MLLITYSTLVVFCIWHQSNIYSKINDKHSKVQVLIKFSIESIKTCIFAMFHSKYWNFSDDDMRYNNIINVWGIIAIVMIQYVISDVHKHVIFFMIFIFSVVPCLLCFVSTYILCTLFYSFLLFIPFTNVCG